MNDGNPHTTTSCVPSEGRCALPCAEVCSGQGLSHSLADCLARFEREAVKGLCDTGRYRLNYFTWGEGPPLVLVHGVSDSSRSFVQPIAHLARSFRCIAYDLPGFPGDGARLWRYRHAHLIDDLLALLDHLGLVRTYLFASSFGSTISLAALKAHPDRFPRAVLQGPLAYRPLRRAEKVLAWIGRFLPGRMRGMPYREKILREVNGREFVGLEESVWRAFVDWTGETPMATLAHQANWLHGLDLRPLLGDIQQPVLLVVGDNDRVVPTRLSEVVRTGLPSVGQVVLEGCGHVPSWTHPAALAEVVRQFLTPPGQGTCPPACAATCAVPGSGACGHPGPANP